MNAPVPLGLWLVALAAAGVVTITVVAVILSSGERPAARRAAALVLVWLAAVVALGSAGVFAATSTTVVPLIAAAIVVPIVAGVWLTGRPGSAQRLAGSLPLHRAVGVQVYRAAGVIFLIAWASGRMPALFALPAGIGDIAVGLGAPVVAARLRADADVDERTRRLAVAWNVLGITDLGVAVALGFFTSPSAFQLLSLGAPNTLITRMPFVLVPAFAVPLSIVLHVIALRRLRGAERAGPALAHAAAANEWELRFSPERRFSESR
ncbi:MAG TPA: hypothetical protein VF155_02630 [Candidatus Dormibacteraeota bacterium]